MPCPLSANSGHSLFIQALDYAPAGQRVHFVTGVTEERSEHFVRVLSELRMFQERRHGLRKACLHIDNGAVLVEGKGSDFTSQNVMHFPHVSLRLRKGMPNATRA